jgi:diguanylate cyclase
MLDTREQPQTNATACLTYVLDSMAAGEMELSERRQSELPATLRYSLERFIHSFKARIAAATQLESRDSLTGLLTPTAFRNLVSERLSHSPWPCALLMVGIEGWKRVIDADGHGVGDQLITLAASRIASALDAAQLRLGEARSALACRLNADEFAIFVEDADSTEVERRARDILHALREPFFISRRAISTSASIGIAMAPEHGRYFDHLHRHADLALRTAKANGLRDICLFRHAFAERAREKANKEVMLREAIVNGEFELYFQPLVACRGDQDPQKVEALIRWHHPEQGILTPDAFMPLAEECGLAGEIDQWVIASAMRTAARWQEAGHRYRIAINISSRELLERDIALHVREWLARTGAQTDLLEIEITESAMMMADTRLLEQLDQLRTLGLGLSIDDFGTGYSNLARLMQAPFDTLKIDRSLVKGTLEDPVRREVLSCVIRLGKAMRCEIVAEGIESEAEASAFAELGCDLLQGYHFSQPLPEAETLLWLEGAATRRTSDQAS